MVQNSGKTQRIYRVDRFKVPDSSRAEFLDKVRQTHELLRVQPAFLQDMLLEQPLTSGEHNVITIVEWENEAAIASAKAKVQAMHARANFNPQELIARLGIKADIASYRHV